MPSDFVAAQQPSTDREAAVRTPLSGLQIDAQTCASLGVTFCSLAGHLDRMAAQISTISLQEAEALLGRTVEALISLTRNLHPNRALQSSRNQPIRLTVERFIEANLSSPDMSPVTIAQDLEIPRSTLYKAFIDVGGVAKHIQDRRLDVAWSLLLRPEECRSLGQISSSIGFASCATFSKAFRKRFGQSPRSMRVLGTNYATTLRRIDVT